MGVMLASRNLAQVSINLTDFEQTPMHVVFEAVRREAERYGVSVAGSEIVGLIPRKAIELSAEYFLRYENFRPELVLENRIAEALAARGGLPEFLDALASPTATPGGGSAAAAAAAMAAALGSMVTRLAKLDSDAFEDDRRFFTEAVDRDAEAFNQVMLAYKRPKAERAPFIEEALHGAAEVPLQVMERIHAHAAAPRRSRDPRQIRQRSRRGQGLGSRRPRRCARKRQHQSGVNPGRRLQECGSACAPASTGMKTDLAVLNCRQVVTLAGPPGPRSGPAMRDLAIIADGALRVRDGKSSPWVRARRSRARCSADTEIVDAGGRIVLPGFVDAHTHPVFAGNRAAEFERRVEGATYAEIAASGGGIRSTVRLTREAYGRRPARRRPPLRGLVPPRRHHHHRSQVGIRPLYRSRNQNSADHPPARRRRAFALRPHFPGRSRSPRRISRPHRRLRRSRDPRDAAARCPKRTSPNTATSSANRTSFPWNRRAPCCSAAQALGFGLRVHADQFSADYGSLLAAELACRHSRPSGILDAGRDGRPACGRRAARAASGFGLQPRRSTRYPAARRMIDLGLPVVLATDFNPGSSPTASMPMVLSLAATQMKMTPAESITAATINAAYSLRRGRSIGSLEAGKAADFVIHDCDDYRELPYFFGRDPRRLLGGACIRTCRTETLGFGASFILVSR